MEENTQYTDKNTLAGASQPLRQRRFQIGGFHCDQEFKTAIEFASSPDSWPQT